jgi:uncharacterized protein YehS (DUF1456 family)
MLNNNDIMKKLRVALKLRDTDIIDILKLAEFETTPTELSAIFRKEDHINYMPCGDQLLRRFLDGLIIRNRGKMERKPASAQAEWVKCKPLPKKEHKANA